MKKYAHRINLPHSLTGKPIVTPELPHLLVFNSHTVVGSTQGFYFISTLGGKEF